MKSLLVSFATITILASMTGCYESSALPSARFGDDDRASADRVRGSSESRAESARSEMASRGAGGGDVHFSESSRRLASASRR